MFLLPENRLRGGLVGNPRSLPIYETEHWLINRRIDTALPGYLMVGSTSVADDLSDLSDGALISLGGVLANAQRTLKSVLQPAQIYMGRFGHSSGYPVHFHLIPIYEWVEDLFWTDPRYRMLAEFGQCVDGKATDGAELTFFVWREFCERAEPPPIEGASVTQVIGRLREEIRHLKL